MKLASVGRRTIFMGAFAAIVFTLGCQKEIKEEKIETTAMLEFQVSQRANPDDDGRASPIVVSIVKLRDSRQFEREDLLSLYQDPEQRLGNDFLGIIRLKEFAPGEIRREDLSNADLPPEVRYLGLIAEYSRYQTAKATLALPVISDKKNRYSIAVGAEGLSVE